MPLTPANELAALVPYPQKLAQLAANPPPPPPAPIVAPGPAAADPRLPKPPDINNVAMPKLETPFVQQDDTMDYPWYQTLVNIWKLQQKMDPTKFPGTYFGITFNEHGQATDANPVGVTIQDPNLTGDPKAPTPPTADNDTSVATTAFVKNQGYLTTVTINGDVTGSGAATVTVTVVGLQGRPVSTAAPNPGYVLAWNGATWAPAPPGIPEAPLDGQRYARQSGTWVPF